MNKVDTCKTREEKTKIMKVIGAISKVQVSKREESTVVSNVGKISEARDRIRLFIGCFGDSAGEYASKVELNKDEKGNLMQGIIDELPD